MCGFFLFMTVILQRRLKTCLNRYNSHGVTSAHDNDNVTTKGD